MPETSDGRLHYVPSLDGLRALAVTAVVAGHMAVFHADGGTMGVFVFYVLSGFLITTLLTQETVRTGQLDLATFFVKRAARLLPALLLVVIATDLYLAFDTSNPVRGVTLGSTPAVLFYYANWEWFAHGVGSLGWFGHMWSLGVEEQFYLVWPIVVIVGLKMRASTSAKLGFLGVCCLVSLVLRVAALHHGGGTFFGTPMIADQLFYGAGLAVALQDRRLLPLLATGLRLTILPAIAYLLFYFVALGSVKGGTASQFLNGPGLSLVGLSTAVSIGYLVARRDGALSRLFSSRLPVAIGRISYEMYLWHILLCFGLSEKVRFGPGTHLLYWLGGYGLTLLFAWATHRFVSLPANRSARRILARRGPRPDQQGPGLVNG